MKAADRIEGCCQRLAALAADERDGSVLASDDLRTEARRLNALADDMDEGIFE